MASIKVEYAEPDQPLIAAFIQAPSPGGVGQSPGGVEQAPEGDEDVDMDDEFDQLAGEEEVRTPRKWSPVPQQIVSINTGVSVKEEPYENEALLLRGLTPKPEPQDSGKSNDPWSLKVEQEETRNLSRSEVPEINTERMFPVKSEPDADGVPPLKLAGEQTLAELEALSAWNLHKWQYGRRPKALRANRRLSTNNSGDNTGGNSHPAFKGPEAIHQNSRVSQKSLPPYPMPWDSPVPTSRLHWPRKARTMDSHPPNSGASQAGTFRQPPLLSNFIGDADPHYLSGQYNTSPNISPVALPGQVLWTGIDPFGSATLAPAGNIGAADVWGSRLPPKTPQLVAADLRPAPELGRTEAMLPSPYSFQQMAASSSHLGRSEFEEIAHLSSGFIGFADSHHLSGPYNASSVALPGQALWPGIDPFGSTALALAGNAGADDLWGSSISPITPQLVAVDLGPALELQRNDAMLQDSYGFPETAASSSHLGPHGFGEAHTLLGSLNLDTTQALDSDAPKTEMTELWHKLMGPTIDMIDDNPSRSSSSLPYPETSPLRFQASGNKKKKKVDKGMGALTSPFTGDRVSASPDDFILIDLLKSRARDLDPYGMTVTKLDEPNSFSSLGFSIQATTPPTSDGIETIPPLSNVAKPIEIRRYPLKLSQSYADLCKKLRIAHNTGYVLTSIAWNVLGCLQSLESVSGRYKKGKGPAQVEAIIDFVRRRSLQCSVLNVLGQMGSLSPETVGLKSERYKNSVPTLVDDLFNTPMFAPHSEILETDPETRMASQPDWLDAIPLFMLGPSTLPEQSEGANYYTNMPTTMFGV
ncbi:hypothetical protein M231_07656 [Tremella mesenterica]|uniref:Uncharacterized protein n=1 Tax=Tremella mesenterica TaxID=5217 RepID=A0A4Q1BBR3_TREME|nr:hypothetical protein M231_07656 [Tremella mesenterica]